LNYDTNTNLGAFVQSGKVTGHGFIVRHHEHAKISKGKNPSNSLYFGYPLQEVGNQITRHKQGVSHHLGKTLLQDLNQTNMLHWF